MFSCSLSLCFLLNVIPNQTKMKRKEVLQMLITYPSEKENNNNYKYITSYGDIYNEMK